MIATIVLSLTIGIAFIVQTLNRYACKALMCVRDVPEVELTSREDEVVHEVVHKNERPRLTAPAINNMIHTEEL
jgi:hypothetical protein